MSYIFLLQLSVPAAVLAVVFVYARLRAGADLDLSTGATAYCAIALAISAIVLASGAARLATAAFGGIDEDWTYGNDTGLVGPLGLLTGQFQDYRGVDVDRTGRDAGAGAGLVAAGLLTGAVHLWLRRRIVDSEQHDDAAGLFVDATVLIGIGIVAIALVAGALSAVGARMRIDEGGPAPGGAVAFAASFAALAAVYAYRVVRELGLLPGVAAAEPQAAE